MVAGSIMVSLSHDCSFDERLKPMTNKWYRKCWLEFNFQKNDFQKNDKLRLILDNTKQFQSVAITSLICWMINGETELFAVPQRIGHYRNSLLSFGLSPTEQFYFHLSERRTERKKETIARVWQTKACWRGTFWCLQLVTDFPGTESRGLTFWAETAQPPECPPDCSNM